MAAFGLEKAAWAVESDEEKELSPTVVDFDKLKVACEDIFVGAW